MDAKKLRIVYMGTPDFAVEPLRRLVEGGYNVVAVVTVADKPAGRGLQVTESAVKRYARSVGSMLAVVLPDGIPVLQPLRLKSEQFMSEFKALDADLAIVVAFRMLPESIWSMPRLGTFNLHASLLPKYRGAAPINWAIMNGETQTGITTFMLDRQIDCGAIIMREIVDISPTMTAGQLHDRLMLLGGDLVLKSVETLAGPVFTPIPQCDSHATAAPKIFKSDCRIDWNHGVVSIYNKIRGLSPYPAAWFEISGTTAKVFDAHYSIFSDDTLTPSLAVATGTIETDGRTFLRLAAIDGWIYIDQIQVAGKRSMQITDFLRGYNHSI